MSSLWKKLNLKDQRQVAVLDAPASFAPALEQLSAVDVITRLEAVTGVELLLAFVTRAAEVEALAAWLGPNAPGDPIIWLAYPKARSKHATSELNRDTGWRPLGIAGFEAVRQVAIDDDWSALRFRRVEHIKTMKRDHRRAMTPEGKTKAGR